MQRDSGAPGRAGDVRRPAIPAHPCVARRDLPDEQKAKQRAFFLTYGTDRPGADVAHERKVLADLGNWGGFIPSSNAQLLPVRQVAAFKEGLATENNWRGRTKAPGSSRSIWCGTAATS